MPSVKGIYSKFRYKNYTILIEGSSELNPFKFKPDVYNKLTESDVVYVIRCTNNRAQSVADRMNKAIIKEYVKELSVFSALVINDEYVVIKDDGTKQLDNWSGK